MDPLPRIKKQCLFPTPTVFVTRVHLCLQLNVKLQQLEMPLSVEKCNNYKSSFVLIKDTSAIVITT